MAECSKSPESVIICDRCELETNLSRNMYKLKFEIKFRTNYYIEHGNVGEKANFYIFFLINFTGVRYRFIGRSGLRS